MPIKIILIAVLIFIFFYFTKFSQSTAAKAWKRIIFLLIIAFGITTIIYPSLINLLANFLGVGRGTDLLLYLLFVSFIFMTLTFYLKINILNDKLNKTISKISLIEGNKESGKKKK